MTLTRSKRKKRSEPLRVFVLEDDLELSAVIEHVLRSVDSTISLDWATSADEAISLLRENRMNRPGMPYDLIVIDLFLDGKTTTGIDCWKICQELFPDVPIILTSVLSLDRFFSMIGRQSISPPYLQKPFTISECRHMFMNMLGFKSSENFEDKRVA